MVHVPTEEILTQIDEDEVHAGSDRNMSEYTVNPRLQLMGLWSVAMLLPDRWDMARLANFLLGKDPPLKGFRHFIRETRQVLGVYLAAKVPRPQSNQASVGCVRYHSTSSEVLWSQSCPNTSELFCYRAVTGRCLKHAFCLCCVIWFCV